MHAATEEKYRRRLKSLIERLQPSVNALTEDVHNAAGGRATGELTNAPMHLGDMGTEEYLFDLSATFLENETYLITEARDALERMDDGAYGACEWCGAQIATARLDALPFVRHCVGCAEKGKSALPQGNLNEGRPKTPRDTLAPEGQMNEDRRTAPSEEPFFDSSSSRRRDNATRDEHAVGTPGGGSASGGLAGSNQGRGDPDIAELLEEAAGGNRHADEARDDESPRPTAGRSGGAVGGTPANKRAKPR